MYTYRWKLKYYISCLQIQMGGLKDIPEFNQYFQSRWLNFSCVNESGSSKEIQSKKTELSC